MADDDTILVRLKLQNGREFQSELAGASGGVKHFGDEVHKTGKKTEFARVETFAWRQGIYTLRRELFYGTAAVTAFAVGTLKLGFTFDEAQKSGTNFFTTVLGSATLARREMRDLTTVTHQTGLQLATITEGAKRMQGFGFATREASKDLRILGNYAERAGLGAGGFDSLVNVFDRVKQSGQLNRTDVRTLTSMGIPALQILRRELGLTAAQYAALQHGKLNIPARFALPALASGLDRRAGTLGTNLSQQVGVSHSYLSEIFGTGGQGLFGFATHGLERVNALLGRATAGQQRGGTNGLLLGLDSSGHTLQAWRSVVSVFHAAAGAILFVWRVTWPLRMLLGGLAIVLGLIARQTTLVTLAFKVLAAWYLITRGRLIALILWQKAKLALDKLEYIYVWLGVRALQAQTAAQWALNLAMDANPIGIFLVGVVALSAALYVLAERYKVVRDLLRDASGTGKHTNSFLDAAFNAIPGLGPVRQLVQGVRSVPGLAGGGDVTHGGTVMVGERGRELLHLPAGARVTPLNANMSSVGQMLQPIIEVYFDSVLVARQLAENHKSRKTLGEANATYRAEVGAHV